ncbi:hypothetical protein [Lacisediminihabitans changchengi]|uniref:hypothetical protein n=1 Tax=Lacisediminihabitans changchengi TaxID=2787634 RepID=UPI001F28710A|nr:hypothetical protein [Lacisediminihabitans changchengi]
MITVALLFVGHNISYTFITPYLHSTLHVAGGTVSILLLTFGLGGIVGNFAGVRSAFWAGAAPLLLALINVAVFALRRRRRSTDSVLNNAGGGWFEHFAETLTITSSTRSI